MNIRRLRRFLCGVGTGIIFLPMSGVLWGSVGVGGGGVQGSGKVLFNRDIRPILSENCYPCHGFDAKQRKAELRLDTAEGASALHEGRQAVKGGDLEGSELWRRINSKDGEVRMPPEESGKKLEPEQIALLGRWIEEGGVYQKHWAFEPPEDQDPPKVGDAGWCLNPVDAFILSRLEQKGLRPSKEASRETLIRRVTLDLTGLPPTPAEVDGFLKDNEPGAYERVVERLLGSPRYGEHMARYWLDVARYGDTHGLHLDNERSMWPYRDWVVRAFNENLSFDKFTIWQLAGDLLPEPTREQLIASGFNRCNVSTSEGGAIDEEFQVRYAVDRVETTSTAWMGLTMGCAVCHDHKLDPITQKEFYEVFSIFNNISEKAMDGNALLPPPSLPLPTEEQEKRLAELDRRKSGLEERLREVAGGIEYREPEEKVSDKVGDKVEDKVADTGSWGHSPLPGFGEVSDKALEKVWVDEGFPKGAVVEVNSGNEAFRWVEGPVYSGVKALVREGKGLHQTFFAKCDEPLVIGGGDRLFAYVYVDPEDLPKAIMLQFHTDEWRHRAVWGDPDAIVYGKKGTPEKVVMGALPEAGKWVRLEVEGSALGLTVGMRVTGLAFTQFDGRAYWDKAGQVLVNDPGQDPERSLVAWEKAERELGNKSSAPEEIKKLLKKEKREEAEEAKLRGYYVEQVYGDEVLKGIRKELAELGKARTGVEKEIPATMISRELEEPRKAWVLIRGEYDKHGERVGPGVPGVLPGLPESEKTNRLTFARWLVDPGHPLTGRVTVNRFWQQIFGTGIVKTSEDFGTRGEWPSHPELLDWLAREFVGGGWDVKGLVRLMVTSATYRQSSEVTAEMLRVDPENRLLARGPRVRLDAEAIRDNALYVSGLLNGKMGGRGVRTYQPPGIWEAVGYTTSNTAKYTQDEGEALYRRSLYLFWKRTAPPPSMTTFDAPSREQCRARRERTNTPLQALLTLNDTQYVEAARQLGYRLLREGGGSDVERLDFGFRLVTGRHPDAEEREVLGETLASSRAHYGKAEDEARKLIEVGDSETPADVPAAELAAYTVVANLLLNLDETLTKN